MSIIEDLSNYMSGEEEIDTMAQDSKDIKLILSKMKKLGITSLDDENMNKVLDDLYMDSDRFNSLLPMLSKKISGK